MAMAFSFRQIRYFVGVAENGSISGAAQHLSVSQSTITEAIQDLEHEVGFKLVTRSQRGVMLTLKGQQFLRHALKILADIADARRALRDEATTVAGRLELGVTPLVASYVLADLLSRFRRAFPHVQIGIVEDSRDYLEHLLIGGELDVAVVVLPASSDQPALQAEVIEASRFRLWLPVGHPMAEQSKVQLASLAEEPHVLLTVDEIAETAETAWRRLGMRPPVAFRTRSVEALRSLVGTGAGVAVLPDLTYRPWSLDGDRIEARIIEDDLPAVSVGLLWRRGSTLSAQAAGFISVARMPRSERSR
jgi:DNA-binding transcriptional LysR family regulator